MKKLTGLLSLLFLLSFFGCQKSEPLSLTEIKAHVISSNDSTTVGVNYYIRLDSTGETVTPMNLPPSFQSSGAVAVKFVNTGKKAWSALPDHPATQVVYLVAIRQL